MVSETKLDDTFSTSQYLIQGYSTRFRKGRTSKGGGMLLYVKKDISCKIIRTKTDAYYEVFSLKLTSEKKLVTKLLMQFT